LEHQWMSVNRETIKRQLRGLAKPSLRQTLENPMGCSTALWKRISERDRSNRHDWTRIENLDWVSQWARIEKTRMSLPMNSNWKTRLSLPINSDCEKLDWVSQWTRIGKLSNENPNGLLILMMIDWEFHNPSWPHEGKRILTPPHRFD